MGTGLCTSRLVSGLLIAVLSTVVSCRTTVDDVHRWGDSLNGPKRLEAVIRHDKYPVALRTEAAMTLVRMRPRNGRRVGIEGGDDPEQRGFLVALAALSKETRAKIVSQMIPELQAGMNSPPANPGLHKADASFPYKDAAFSLLTYDKGTLITSEEDRRRLRESLAQWAAADFAGRMEETSQISSMDQVLGHLGAQGVQPLAQLMGPDSPKLDRMAEFIAELGDDATRLQASQKLVEISGYVMSPKWLEARAPSVQKANQESKLNPTPKQFQEQLATYQEEETIRLFSSMKRVGGRPIVSYLIQVAGMSERSEKVRLTALAALEGNLDRNDTAQVDALFAVAKGASVPDPVRDQALRRLSELPRKLVIDRFYALFRDKNWKVRWVSAELVLKMSDSSQIADFMAKLGEAKTMALSEPIRYGQVLGDVKGPQTPAEIAAKYAAPDNPVPARLTALGWYFHYGTAGDRPTIQQYSGDKAKTPACEPEAKDCEWTCDIVVDGKPESKEVSTIGDFVRYCVIPEMERRQAAQPQKS